MAGSVPEEPTAPAGCRKAFWSNRCDVVDASVRVTARRLRLQPVEAEDLRSEVWLKLFSSIVVHQQFQGRSSLATLSRVDCETRRSGRIVKGERISAIAGSDYYRQKQLYRRLERVLIGPLLTGPAQ